MRTPSLALPMLLTACAATQPSPEDAGATTIVLQHQPASEMATILEEVLRSRGTCVRAPSHQDRPDRRPVEMPAQLQVRADPARNTLLVRGTTEQVNEALELARRLDVPDVTVRGAR